MSNINYDSVLIGLTYLETFFNGNLADREAILASVTEDELKVAMTSISIILTGLITKTSPIVGSHQDVIESVRKIALKLSD